MELQYMKQPVLDPGLMICPYCQEEERIGVHSIRERRYRCHACEGTFSETKVDGLVKSFLADYGFRVADGRFSRAHPLPGFEKALPRPVGGQ